MSIQPSGNKLPSSYSLPPPPPPSSIGNGKGKGRGRGKGRGSGRFQPLLRQNNQPTSLNQQNSQLFGSTYSDKVEQLLPKIEKNEISHKFNNFTDNRNLINRRKNLLATINKKYSSQDQFASLLDSFNSNIFDNVQNLRKSFEEKYSVPHRSNNSPDDKYQNKSLLGKQLNINDHNDQASTSRSNFLQSKHPVEQVTLSHSTNASSSSQLKKQVPPDDSSHQVNFAAVAKAALAATSALQYKDQNADDKHNNVKSNNQNEWHCESCANSFSKEIQLKVHKCKKFNNDESRLKPVMNFNLDTPESIAKWIEDRKKNYPTDVNIARKKELEAERIARGKVLKAQAQAKKRSLNLADSQKSYGTIKKMRLGNGWQINNTGRNGSCGATDLLVAASSAGAPLDDKIMRMLQPTLSRLSTLFKNRNLITNNRVFKTVPNSKVSVPKKNKMTGNFYSKVCIKYRQGHCPRGKDCTNKHTGTMICPPLQRPPDDARCRQRNLRELLLYKEIVEEKNMILQCLRHIVNNDFFGVVTHKAIKDAKKRGEALVTEVGDRVINNR